jgi:hypothetical protein
MIFDLTVFNFFLNINKIIAECVGDLKAAKYRET